MVTCKICKEEIQQNDSLYVKCVSCGLYLHANTKMNNCAEITASEEKVIILKATPKLLYRCSECAINNIANTGLTEMMSKFNEAVVQLNSATENLNKYTEDLKNIKDEQTNILSKLPVIEDRLSVLENKQSSSSTNVQDVIAEINLQKIKEKNVMIFNLHDHKDTQKDLDYIKKFLSNNNVNTNNISMKRIGIFNKDKKRPIKLFFKTRYEAFNLLKKSKIIASKSKHKIFITNDKTIAQQQYEKEIRSQLKTRIDNGENNLKIKYINSIPKIIEVFTEDSDNENTISDDDKSNKSFDSQVSNHSIISTNKSSSSSEKSEKPEEPEKSIRTHSQKSQDSIPRTQSRTSQNNLKVVSSSQSNKNINKSQKIEGKNNFSKTDNSHKINKICNNNVSDKKNLPLPLNTKIKKVQT